MKRNSNARNSIPTRQNGPASSRRRHAPQVRVLGRPVITRQAGRLPFGNAFEARLPYVENFPLSCDGTTGLTTTGSTFYGNNIYDPRIQVGGHQPLQFDILAAVFVRYVVHRVDFEVEFSNPLYDGMWVGYRVRHSFNGVATSGQNLEYIQEMDNTACVPLNNTGSQKVVLRGTFLCRDILGISSAMYEDLSLTGTTSGSVVPSNLIYIEPFGVHSVSGETSTVRCNVRIIYHARFSDRITAPPS